MTERRRSGWGGRRGRRRWGRTGREKEMRRLRGIGVLAALAVASAGCASAPSDAVPPPPEAADPPRTAPGLRSGDDPTEPLVVRPVPAPVVPPSFVRNALARGTRSPDGSPGPDHWRNQADYDVDAALDPATGRLTGTATITYTNRSPLTLGALVLHLHQNLHAEGVLRNEAAEVTGGVELVSVRVAGREAREGSPGGPPFYEVDGALMVVALPSALPGGGSVELEVEWAVTLPQNSSGRMGWSGREMYYVAYWFPKVAVFDDLRGWDAEPYTGGAEFYDEFGDYDVRLTVPGGWTVMATGELENPAEVYRPVVLERLAAASTADTTIHVVTVEDRLASAVTVEPGEDGLTYRFTAENVRDFAWTASNMQLWDATSAVVPDRDGDGADDRVLIHAFWRRDRAPLWSEQALYGKQSIEFHSRFTGFAYPWPHMTSVEGDDIIRGGMEFPMMTLIGSYGGRDASDLFNVTSHELAHMWIPMIVGTNEKR
ncbi:MAG TPA: M1 family metallopeptidase, partial [Longimicrobiales bacterium]|nr:M1 family metallopeptidase [Longimicrobiales bacterium]